MFKFLLMEPAEEILGQVAGVPCWVVLFGLGAWLGCWLFGWLFGCWLVARLVEMLGRLVAWWLDCVVACLRYTR